MREKRELNLKQTDLENSEHFALQHSKQLVTDDSEHSVVGDSEQLPLEASEQKSGHAIMCTFCANG